MGMADNYINAYPSNPTLEMYQSATTAYNISIGAWVMIGLAAADTVFRVVRYLYTSRSDAAPLVQFPKIEAPPEEEIPLEDITPENIQGENP
jgi:hypothetical protein